MRGTHTKHCFRQDDQSIKLSSPSQAYSIFLANTEVSRWMYSIVAHILAVSTTDQRIDSRNPTDEAQHRLDSLTCLMPRLEALTNKPQTTQLQTGVRGLS